MSILDISAPPGIPGDTVSGWRSGPVAADESPQADRADGQQPGHGQQNDEEASRPAPAERSQSGHPTISEDDEDLGPRAGGQTGGQSSGNG